MDITTRSTMAWTEHGKEFRFRTEQDIWNCIQMVTQDRPYVLYRGSCGFIFAHTPEEYLRQMLADQELYKKQSGLRVRVNDVYIERSLLNKFREDKEIVEIAQSMASYYAAEGFPTIYNIWSQAADSYVITYVISIVSPADGKKYTWNDDDKYQREKAVLETIVYRVTGKNKPEEEFDFRTQEYY